VEKRRRLSRIKCEEKRHRITWRREKGLEEDDEEKKA
jgi:hypothetical protein